MLDSPFKCSRPLFAAIALTVTIALLGGCAQIQSVTQKPDDALAIDPADPCGVPRAKFSDERGYFTERILETAGIGALGGAIAGGAIAGASHGNIVAGILIGGASGAVLGATAGYYQTMSQKYQDQQALAQGINSDMATERARMDDVTLAFNNVRKCRFAEARRIKLAVRAHKEDRTAAITELDYQHDRFTEELALAHKLGINMEKRDTEFETAADKLRADDKAAKAQAATQASMAANKTIPEKRGSFERSIGAAEAESQIAFNIDAAPTRS